MYCSVPILPFLSPLLLHIHPPCPSPSLPPSLVGSLPPLFLSQVWMLQAVSRLSRAAVRVRTVAAQVQVTTVTMAQNHQSCGTSCQQKGGAVTAAILIIGDEILKVILEMGAWY